MVFRNIPEPKNAKITYSQVAIRKIFPFFFNYWIVILEIDNGQYYVNIQKESNKNKRIIIYIQIIFIH